MTTLDPGIPAKLEFWFDFGSNYSYLSMTRIEALAERHDVAIAWKPFLLGAIFKSFGWESSPFVLQKEKGVYTWRDMARQCEKYGLPWTQPSHFPRSALLPMRVALIGAEQPWISAFCKRLMQINFVEDQDIDDSAVVDVALTKLGLPAQEIIVAAQSEDSKRDMRAQTDEALRRGIFGAPTFFAGPKCFGATIAWRTRCCWPQKKQNSRHRHRCKLLSVPGGSLRRILARCAATAGSSLL